MKNLIYENTLNRFAYLGLYYKENLIYALLGLVDIAVMFSLYALFLLNPSIIQNDAVYVLTNLIIFYVGISILSYLYYKPYLNNSKYPYGPIQVYRSENTITITWFGRDTISHARQLKLNKYELRKNYTYIEESKKNFVYLPASIFEVLNRGAEYGQEGNFTYIGEQELDTKKLTKMLWLRRIPYFVVSFVILVAAIIGIIIYYITLANDGYRRSYIDMAMVWVILSFFASCFSIFYAFIAGGIQALNKVELYRSKNQLVLLWQDKKGISLAKKISIDNRRIIGEYLYIREKYLNNIYLPKEVNNLLGKSF